MKKRLYALTNHRLIDSFVAVLDKLDREPEHLLRVLTYHRVDEMAARPNLAPDLLSASPKAFQKQMAMIQKNYTLISIEQVLEFYRQGKSLPKRSILVTFDDAYHDFAENAWPILKQYDIPVTLFVPTSYPDNATSQLWWDQLFNAMKSTENRSVDTPVGPFSLETEAQRVTAYKQLRNYVKRLPHFEAIEWVNTFCLQLGVPGLEDNSILGWDALKQLSDEGVTMAPHTQTHPLVHRISVEAARKEVTQSWNDLKDKIGDIPPVFAYPGGGVSDEIVQMLKEEQIELAFTTVRGINKLKTANPLLLKRINVGYSTTLSMLRAQCLPSVTYLG